VNPVALCRAEDVAEGAGRGFRLGEGTAQIAVFVIRWRGTLHAYVNSCPHIGTPLDWAPDRFLSRDGTRVICSTHGAEFEPMTGECVRGPCFGDRLEAVNIEIRDGTILVPADAGL